MSQALDDISERGGSAAENNTSPSKDIALETYPALQPHHVTITPREKPVVRGFDGVMVLRQSTSLGTKM
jgi:hypothetical protein